MTFEPLVWRPARDSAGPTRGYLDPGGLSEPLLIRPAPSVYFATLNDFIKIGVANSAPRRMTSLQVGCPYPLTLRAVIVLRRSGDAFNLEGTLHERFKDSRGVGEWFKTSDALDAYITAHGASSRSDLAFQFSRLGLQWPSSLPTPEGAEYVIDLMDRLYSSEVEDLANKSRQVPTEKTSDS